MYHVSYFLKSVQLNEYETASTFYSIKPKLDIRLFVDFCVFTCIYWFLHDVLIKLVCRSKQFYEYIMQKLVKTGKYTEINKQSHVKFWLNWRKYRSVTYSFSFTKKLSTPGTFTIELKQLRNPPYTCENIVWILYSWNGNANEQVSLKKSYYHFCSLSETT